MTDDVKKDELKKDELKKDELKRDKDEEQPKIPEVLPVLTIQPLRLYAMR